VEGLSGLVRAVVAFGSVRLEQVSPARGQDDDAIVGTERARANQSLALKMSSAPTRTVGIVAQIMKIALGDDPKCADGPQHAALSAIDLVNTVALPNGLALTPTRQVEVSREHVTRITFHAPVAIAGTSPTSEAAIPRALTVGAVARSRVIPVEHDAFSQRIKWRSATRSSLLREASMSGVCGSSN
jgi:hypothetical protein